MDTALLTTVITVSGSIITAIIAGVTTLIVELIKNGKISPDSFWRWVKRFGYPAALVIAVGGGAWVFAESYDGTASRLERALPDIPEYKKRIYARVGLGFIYPGAWQVEDYAMRFGGGGIELISGRDAAGLIETQGVWIEIVNIAEHHSRDPQSEFKHVEERLAERCGPNNVSRTVAPLSGGLQADLFTCRRVKGAWTKVEWMYWHQLSKCLRLKVFAWSELSGAPRIRFEQELAQFLRHLQIDDIKRQSLNSGKRTGCVDTTG